MSRKHNVSHNVCSVYDYSTLRWKVHPSDIVAFDVRDGVDDDYALGEVILLTGDLIHIRRLKDGFIFVFSLYDIRDFGVTPVNTVRRLQHGIFSVGERVDLNGAFNFSIDEFTIEKFALPRVLLRYSTKGRTVGSFWVLQGEILKFKEEKK